MPSFRTGVVVRLLEERRGLQRVEVDLGDGPERAYVLTQLTGPVGVGDRVVVNTTAVELGLGTGGWHVVHWNLAREEWRERGPGHVLKARYTSLQADVGSTEEHETALVECASVDGMPVVAAGLHSQVPAVAAAFKTVSSEFGAPGARLVYVMTDGAGLPLALSDLVAALTDRGLLDATVTCGQAFGGDFEAVSVFSALAVARHVAGADAVVVAMGPGVAGTGTRLGFSAIEVGPVLDAAAALGGRPIACLRASFADPRPRHQGLSHHSATALGLACRTRVTIPLPLVGGVEEETLRAGVAGAGLDHRHDVVAVKPPDILGLFAQHGLAVTSMGRPAAADPVLFACGAAAGALAAERVFPTNPGMGCVRLYDRDAMADRLERLTNLVSLLLETRRPLTLEEIVERVPGYPAERESYRRQFERDKATLREIGVPISLEALYAFDQETGYRIHRDDYELPPLDLSDDERVALHLAVTAVRLEGGAGESVGGAGREALLKLGGFEGVATPTLDSVAALPDVPALPALFDAYRLRARVTFIYRGGVRRLDPYGILFRNGHWYAVGFDADREAIRAFRADRIESGIEPGPGGTFERPDGFDPASALRDEPWRFGDEEPVEALVLVSPAQAGWVEADLGAKAVAERRDDGSVVVRMAVTNREAFRSFVLGLLDHAEVLAPPELRADMVAWLSALAAEGPVSGGSA